MKKVFSVIRAELIVFAIAYLPLAFIYADLNLMEWSGWGRFLLITWIFLVHLFGAILSAGKKMHDKEKKLMDDFKNHWPKAN